MDIVIYLYQNSVPLTQLHPHGPFFFFKCILNFWHGKLLQVYLVYSQACCFYCRMIVETRIWVIWVLRVLIATDVY